MEEWFYHFDDNRSGAISRSQLLRALVKSSGALDVLTVEETLNPLGLLPPEDPEGAAQERISFGMFQSIDAILSEVLTFHAFASSRGAASASDAPIDGRTTVAVAAVAADAPTPPPPPPPQPDSGYRMHWVTDPRTGRRSLVRNPNFRRHPAPSPATVGDSAAFCAVCGRRVFRYGAHVIDGRWYHDECIGRSVSF